MAGLPVTAISGKDRIFAPANIYPALGVDLIDMFRICENMLRIGWSG
jgi:hypothetical protein